MTSQENVNLSSYPRRRFHLQINFWWLIFIALNFFVYLNYSIGTPICFDDCLSYTELMGKGSLTRYITTWHSMWRPWFVPVFFSFFGEYSLSSALSINIAQTIILFISWTIFAASIAQQFSGRFAKITFVILSLSIYAQQYYILNRYLLSDSLALSTLLFFLSIVISFSQLRKKIGIKNAICLLLITALIATGSRDANVMFALLGTIYILFFNYKTITRLQLLTIIVAIAIICINQMNHASYRHYLNVKHVLAGFVLPHPAVADFFITRGMPANLNKGIDLKPQEWCTVNYPQINENARLANIPDKYIYRASKIYALWLLSHPIYVMQQAFNDRDCILGQSYATSPSLLMMGAQTEEASYIRPGEKATAIQQGIIRIAPADFFDPKIKMMIALSLSVLFIFLYALKKNNYLAVSVFLIVSGFLNAVSSYFADMWSPSEMLRHAFIGSIIFNVGFVVSIIAAIAFLFSFFTRSRQTTKNALH